jgi:hypothetical protein
LQIVEQVGVFLLVQFAGAHHERGMLPFNAPIAPGKLQRKE